MGRSNIDWGRWIFISAVLHVLAGLAIWYYWPKTPPAPFEFGQGVAINVITSAQPPPAEQADVVQQAQTETPAPEPTPTPPAPQPAPTTAALKSFVAPSKAAPIRQSPGRQKPAEDDFLNSASKSLGGGSPPTKAPPGPTQPGKNRQPRKGDASDLTGAELTDLAGPLFQNWSANVQVVGGCTADVTMQVILDGSGHFDNAFYGGRPQLLRKDGSIWPEDHVNGGWVGCNDERNRLTCAAAHRAEAALKKVEPYKVPPRFPGGVTVSFHFDPKKFC